MTIAGQTKTMGQDITVEEVMDIVLQDRNYYRRSGGGLTLSGGECFAQPEFAKALLMAAMAGAEGETCITETVFDSRFGHVAAMRAFGADIRCTGPAAVVSGNANLRPAAVRGTDLRGTAALVLTALQTPGESRIFGLEHLDRGYTGMEKKLSALGASVFRII